MVIQPQDGRMRKMRKKIASVAKKLRRMRKYLDTLPEEIREDMQRQLQAAFEAGQEFSEIDNLPNSAPIDEDGQMRIGPALRFHIMQTRKVYRDVDELRDIVYKIFDEASQRRLVQIMKEQEEKSSGTRATDITIEGYNGSRGR